MIRSRQLVMPHVRANPFNQVWARANTPVRALMTMRTTSVGLGINTSTTLHNTPISTPSILQQLRWQSAMTDEQQDQRVRYLQELDTCRDQGDWRQALNLLDRIDREGYGFDSAMYESAMTACARMGKIEVLPGLLRNMAIDGLVPTSRTIDVVMQAYIAAEEWPLIVQFACDSTDQGILLSEAAFQAAFESCGKERDAERALAMLTNAEALHPREIGLSHYAMAIRACGMGKRADLAARLFTHMEQKRRLEANADTFTQLIRAQIVNRELVPALHTFATARERSDTIQLPESIFTATIDALVQHQDYWQATQLFAHMMALEVPPTVFCLARMMVAYVRLHRHEEARLCWQHIVDINEPSPHLMKYTKLITALASTNDSELAIRVFEYVFPRFDPIQINDATYAAAIRAYGRISQQQQREGGSGQHTQTAMDLFDTFVASRQRANKPLPPRAGIYVAVFNALSRDSSRDPVQNTYDAKRVWDLMVQHVPVVLAPAYASLAGVLASSGELGTLEELLAHAKSTLRSREEEEEEEDTSGMEKTEQEELLFNGVISGFSKARNDQSERIVTYLDLMQQRKMTITDSVLRASADCFIRHQQWQKCNDLWQYVHLPSLYNPEVVCGDIISKLLEQHAWEVARMWIQNCHQAQLHPPIRGKVEILQTLREMESTEWAIAYALARETLSFKQMIQENVESIADAVAVLVAAHRTDLAIKLYERTANHPSIARFQPTPSHTIAPMIPLRMMKQILLACMREHHQAIQDRTYKGKHIEKAAMICTHMLQQHVQNTEHPLDGEALSLAISIKATMGDDEDVLALYETMLETGSIPNSYAFNAAITAYSRRGKIEKGVLGVRDVLVSTNNTEVLNERTVMHSLLNSIARAIHQQEQEAGVDPSDPTRQTHETELVRLRDQLEETVAMLPQVTSEIVVRALQQAHCFKQCVEFFDANVSEKLFYTLLHRILKDTNASTPSNESIELLPRTATALLLKFIAFHGLDRVQPPELILQICKSLVQSGHLSEARAILELYNDPDCEVALTDMEPLFQREVWEMLLFIYGEEQAIPSLVSLVEKTTQQPSAFALNVKHYQLAMEYCRSSELSTRERAARACLRLFETLRSQYVKPNGSVYLLALQSCFQLGQLETGAGIQVVEDAREQGFAKLLSSEMYRLATVAVHERRGWTAAQVQQTMDTPTPVKRGRGRPRKSEMVVKTETTPETGEVSKRGRGRPRKVAVDETVSTTTAPTVPTVPTTLPNGRELKVNVPELVSIALFGHQHGVEISLKLVSKLLELDDFLPVEARTELETLFINKQEADAAWSPIQTATKPATRPMEWNAATAGGPGTRWGNRFPLGRKE